MAERIAELLNKAHEDGREAMKAQITGGTHCCLCDAEFKAPHGYPVACFECWGGMDTTDGDLFQFADADELKQSP